MSYFTCHVIVEAPCVGAKGYADLKQWLDCKAKAKAEGRDVPTATIEMVKDVRKRYD